MPNALPLIFELFYDGVWNAHPCLSEEGWAFRVGVSLEGDDQPNQLGITLNNDTLALDPTYTAGALYGKIGRNTPARIRISGGEQLRCEASSWTPARTLNHTPSANKGQSTIRLEAEGVLRRLGRWTEPLRSPMTRIGLSYASLLGYWPLEDPSGVTSLAQLAPTASPRATYTGALTLGGDPGPGGSDTTPTFGADTRVIGRFAIPTGVTGYQLSFSMRAASIPGSAAYVPLFTWTDTRGRRWTWSMNDTSYGMDVVDNLGVSLLSTFSTFGAYLPTKNSRFRMKITQSGANVIWEPAWYSQDFATVVGTTVMFAGTATGAPVDWQALGSTQLTNGSMSHVFAISDTSVDLLSTNSRKSFNGYIGETASYRIARLCNEESITIFIGGSFTDGAGLGRQKPGTLLQLIREAAASDGGFLFDQPLSIGVHYVTRASVINKTVSLALTKGLNVAYPLVKVIDDVGVFNQVTASNYDGTESTAQLAAGPLSTQAPPNGVGVIKRSLEVSLSTDFALDERVAWELVQGTIDRPRYKDIRVDLLQSPGLAATISALRPGDRITLAGEEPELINLQVRQVRQEGGHVKRAAIITCAPGEPYVGGVFNATTSRFDVASTTLASTPGSPTTATSIAITTPIGSWSTTAVPYDIRIGPASRTDGERVTVTAMTAPAGTGPFTQTATVTRSVNGVVRAVAAGDAFRLADPVRWQ